MIGDGAMPKAIPQQKLMTRVLPLIKSNADRYEKFQRVLARAAVDGEVVESIVEDGKETTNKASAGEYVVRNRTEAQEEYVVSASTFTERYQLAAKIDDTWSEYVPKGQILAIEISRDLLDALGADETFTIMAPWDSEQAGKLGDLFVSPLPELSEVYRIARKEFHETYRRALDSA